MHAMYQDICWEEGKVLEFLENQKEDTMTGIMAKMEQCFGARKNTSSGARHLDRAG